jgi:hypothetical protein
MRRSTTPILVAVFLMGALVVLGDHVFRSGWTGHVGRFFAVNKEALEGLQACVTIIAVIGAGIWFVRRREVYPKADISQVIVHREIAPGQIWMRVSAVLANKGSVRVQIRKTRLIIEQVDPPDAIVLDVLAKPAGERERSLAPWEYLYDRDDEAPAGKCLTEIEPGETDSVFWDVSFRSGAKLVSVYTYLQNEAKRGKGNIGWAARTIYDLEKPLHTPASTVVSHPSPTEAKMATESDNGGVGTGLGSTGSGGGATGSTGSTGSNLQTGADGGTSAVGNSGDLGGMIPRQSEMQGPRDVPIGTPEEGKPKR